MACAYDAFAKCHFASSGRPLDCGHECVSDQKIAVESKSRRGPKGLGIIVLLVRSDGSIKVLLQFDDEVKLGSSKSSAARLKRLPTSSLSCLGDSRRDAFDILSPTKFLEVLSQFNFNPFIAMSSHEFWSFVVIPAQRTLVALLVGDSELGPPVCEHSSAISVDEGGEGSASKDMSVHIAYEPTEEGHLPTSIVHRRHISPCTNLQ